jgi:eukaryotic-like serine/threonine-protein kinase
MNPLAGSPIVDEQTIFLTALEMTDPAERDRWLADACGRDPSLRGRVEALLESHEGASRFLERSPFSKGADRTEPFSTQRAGGNGIPLAEAPDDIPLDFLAPSDQPGVLGMLGPHEILSVIGRGGMGIVFKARDTRLNRIVAVKVLAPEWASNSPARKRFQREALAAAAVTHPHVVTIHAVDEASLPYLVMECVDGQSLRDKIARSGMLDLPETLRIGSQIASGLAAAHKQGLIHRDIKPANILLENCIERVKITDFGLARAADDVTVTRTGEVAGTPEYMSPEQASGLPIDARSDLFSLGSVLYTMCTGRSPFRSDSTIGVIRRVCDAAPRPIREVNPHVPQWLCDIIDRLLEKNPDDRFQTAEEVADLLAEALASVQQSPHEPFVVPPAKVRPAAASSGKSNSAAAWVLILAACAVGIVVVPLVLVAVVGMAAWWALPVADVTHPGSTQDHDPWDAVGAPMIEESQAVLPDAAESATSEAADPASPWMKAPFSTEEAQAYQAAWAEKLGVPIDLTNSIGMNFKLIPPGEYDMGSTQEEIDSLLAELRDLGVGDFGKFAAQTSAPRHRVRITHPIYLARSEVTRGQYEKFVEAQKYVPSAERLGELKFNWRDFGDDPNQPVLGVSWEDANAFCRWLIEEEGLEYSLPSEAQWEWACRAGTTTLWSHGDDVTQLAEYAVYGKGGMPEPVESRKPNPFGLHDMHGNVDEWCYDWHMRDFYSRSPLDHPVNDVAPTDAGSGKVSRGGAWNAAAWWSRSATRTYDYAASPTLPKGFRVILKHPEAAAAKHDRE